VASYGDLIRKVTTAEINRVQREGNYSYWSYFVDEVSGKAGVLFANNTTFAAYEVDDSPDPKLHQFGLETITDLQMTPDPEVLALQAGQNEFRAAVFADPLLIIDDEFTDAYTTEMVLQWQALLRQRGVQLPRTAPVPSAAKLVLGGIVLLAAIFGVIALLG
jgi:hypothetical protein